VEGCHEGPAKEGGKCCRKSPMGEETNMISTTLFLLLGVSLTMSFQNRFAIYHSARKGVGNRPGAFFAIMPIIINIAMIAALFSIVKN
jgi:hypothetical protein